MVRDNFSSELAVVILAAGKGKRMNNPDVPKVMTKLAGTPLIGHVLEQVKRIGAKKIIVIIGHQKESIIEYANKEFSGMLDFVEQIDQLGTGHAVLQAEPLLVSFKGNVLILSGDVPLLRAAAIKSFIEKHHNSKPPAAASVLTAMLDNPKGYGRIVRSSDKKFLRIVEDRDASSEEAEIPEVNSGIYIVKSHELFDALHEIGNNNAQREYYLTDVIAVLRQKNIECNAIIADDPDELNGINTIEELERMEKCYYEKYCDK